MGIEEKNKEYEEVMSSYYEGRGVSSIIAVKVDTKQIDDVADRLCEHQNIEDVYLVTGDYDLFVKARFKDYDNMKHFIIKEASNLQGIEDVKSMMIVTTYKERGNKIEYEGSKD